MLGRRGDGTMVLQAALAIVLLAAVIAITTLYVTQRADSSDYFQRFYAKDLGLLAETAVASPGELIVTYDNIKQGQKLEFTLDRGWFLVEKMVETDEQADAQEGQEQLRELLARKQVYGLYPYLEVERGVQEEPVFLTMIKSGDKLMLKEAGGYLKSCTLFAPAIEKEQLKLDIKMVQNGRESEEFLKGARDTIAVAFREQAPSLSSTDPNMIITVTSKEGPQNTIRITYAKNTFEPDNAYVACILKSQFEGFSTEEFEITVEDTAASHERIEVQVEVTQKNALSERLIGQIVGRGVALYAR